MAPRSDSEPTLAIIHADIKTTMHTVSRLDTLITGGDELDKGLIHEHGETRHRVDDLERSEAKRRKLILSAVTAAIGSSIAAFFAMFGGK